MNEFKDIEKFCDESVDSESSALINEFEKIKKELEKNNDYIDCSDVISEVDVPRNSVCTTGFTVDKIECKKGPILVFTFMTKVSDEDFLKFLAVLNKAVDSKKPFALLVDTRQSKGVPVKASIRLASWMKKRKPDIPGVLLGSSVTTNSNIIIGLVNTAFKIQKPTSPSLLSKDIEKSKKFLGDILNK
jgi:hypothetical protein